MNSNKEYIDG